MLPKISRMHFFFWLSKKNARRRIELTMPYTYLSFSKSFVVLLSDLYFCVVYVQLRYYLWPNIPSLFDQTNEISCCCCFFILGCISMEIHHTAERSLLFKFNVMVVWKCLNGFVRNLWIYLCATNDFCVIFFDCVQFS